MARPYYFGAGPAALPTPVLEEVQSELLDWQGTGLSILELGHRTSAFEGLMFELNHLFRELLSIPPDYHVLWMGGSTREHFGLIPLHFIGKGQTAGYWVTGMWSKLAFQEAQHLKRAHCIASTENTLFRDSPDSQLWTSAKNMAYVYVTPNETIQGVRFTPSFDWSDAPMVADMTSCLLTESIDVANYGLIFAGAQKNLANAGLSVLIMSPEMMARAAVKGIPTALNYQVTAAHHSLYVTPPVFNCYVMLKMMQWLKANGGIANMAQVQLKKAKALYDYIDTSDWYENQVARRARSWVNIPFKLKHPALESEFLEQAALSGLIGLEGHRSVGGLRASLYNAMPLSGVDALIECMQTFKAKRSAR
ncbi:MAG: 3-phosphoserine/phosphohydroxythreonine transaminase [Gammaproteobacteria bacterium]|nr:3-phosphoserine/phosphohydroxythreonine transaminase [Gammaproteobacteria bacterium]